MHYFVRILYDSDSFHQSVSKVVEKCTSRYVVIRHDTIIDEITRGDMSSTSKSRESVNGAERNSSPDYSDTLLLEAVCRALLQGETTAKENGSIKS